MRYLIFFIAIVVLASCSTIDMSKIERQMYIEGRFECETGEYYQAHSEIVPNNSSLNPNATMTIEQYTCARLGEVPKGKEVRSFEYFKQLKADNRETIYMLFVPCKYMKDRTHMCKN